MRGIRCNLENIVDVKYYESWTRINSVVTAGAGNAMVLLRRAAEIIYV